MPKNLLFKTWCLMGFSLLLCNKSFTQNYILDTILNKVNADLRGGIGAIATLDATVAADEASMINNDSAWADANYTNGDGPHLNRMENFAKAYTSPNSSYFGSAHILAKMSNGLAYWYRRKPVHNNWYNNDITYPSAIGRVLIFMRYGSPLLRKSLEDSMIVRMNNGSPYAQTGANKSDVALHFMYRALLTKDAALMDVAVNQSFEPIKQLNGGEGLQYDNTYLQHGNQLMTGSYGWTYLNNAYNVAAYLIGTSYALSSTKLGLLTHFHKNSYLKAGRNGNFDFSAIGRSISRGSGLNNSRTMGVLRDFVAKARLVDIGHDATWDSVNAGIYQKQPLHTHFWRGDYDLHHREGYTFNVRTVSTRTVRTERVNNENLLGKFLPDGATTIMRGGWEYKNIFPIWEWDKIPGTTSRDFATDAGSLIPNNDSYVTGQGSTTFVGGVSDSLFGATVYDMNYNNVSAKKAWFFFNKEVVCLGAGINSTQAENITTSVNQSWLYGDIQVNNAGTVSTISNTANTTSNYASPQWVLHDTVGYFFPAGGNLAISNKIQSGSWNRINSGFASTALSGPVFSMWLNNGVAPTNAKYAYTVVPGLGTVTDMANYNQADIRIVKNTDSIQALKHVGLNIMQVVFYKAGTLTDSGITVAVNRPCVLQLKNVSSNRVALHIADPSQQNSNVLVSLQLPGVSNGAVKQLLAKYPASPYLGSSVAYIIDSATRITEDTFYCAAAGGPNAKDRYITTLTTTGAVRNINYTNGTYPLDGYGLYAADSIVVNQGGTFNLSIANSAQTKWSRAKIYVDWNGNGQFTNTGETVLSVGNANQDNSATMLAITGTINVPQSATIGKARLRIRYYDSYNADPGPCGTVNFTTTQDFLVTVNANPYGIYCAASGGANGQDKYINSLTTTGAVRNISYSNSSYPAGGYSLYASDSVVVTQGGVFTLNMTNSPNSKWCRMKVYADWNGNGNFTDVEENILSVGNANQDNSATMLNIAASIAVPSGATLGKARIRVRFYDAYVADPGTCGQANYTTTHDFLITITANLYAPYCLAAGGNNGTDKYITNLTSTGAAHNISYSNFASPIFGYTLYAADSIMVSQGATFTLNMANSNNSKWSRLKVYIDWNGNGNFTDASETVLSIGNASQDNSATMLAISSSIVVPTNSVVGKTRMRIRFYDAYLADPGACGQTNYTTTYDFYISITPQLFTFYKDADGDGFGNPLDSLVTTAVIVPTGYSSNNADCDDSFFLYADADGDGFGAGVPVACGVANNTDFDDADATIHEKPLIAVLYKDGDNGAAINNQAKPSFQILNNGIDGMMYKHFTFRYWLTAENYAGINVFVDFAQVGNNNITKKYVTLDQPLNGALGYVEFGFYDAAGILQAGGNSGPIQTRFANGNYANFNEADDYSYQPGSTFVISNKITVYYNDVLISGQEPAPVPASINLAVLYENQNTAANSNTIRSYINVKNNGNVSIDYKDLSVRYWFSPEGNSPLNYWIDYAALGASNIVGSFVPSATGDNAYFELKFKETAGKLYPLSGTGNIQYRIAKANWSAFNETNDHSYLPKNSFAENNHIAVYYKGQFVYGVEPANAPVIAGAKAIAPKLISENETALTVPTLVRRGSAWQIRGLQQLNRYEVVIIDMQGRLILKEKSFNNRHLNIAAGVYQYIIKGENLAGKVQAFSGKMMVTD